MWIRIIPPAVVSAMITAGLSVHNCLAAVTFLGPVPYLSRNDSPLPVDGSSPNFFLEDFEDGKLNSPGISQGQLLPPLDELTKAIILPPSINTDSIDADDGAIDGIGQGGHSLASGLTLSNAHFPPSYTFLMEFRFDQSDLGFLPNAFGFVWTDGPLPGSLSLTVTTNSGVQYQSPVFRDLGDDSREGTTVDDMFFGAVADKGITRVRISGGYRGEDFLSPKYMEIDHLQYGLLVPEPASFVQILLCIGVVMAAKSRSREPYWCRPNNTSYSIDFWKGARL